jgi:hypothetical protein
LLHRILPIIISLNPSQVVSPKYYALQAFIELDAADALNEQLQIQFGREPSPALDL